MSQQGVTHLLTHLSRDLKTCHGFQANPDLAMAGLDLTADERSILKRARPEEIRDYLGREAALFKFGILKISLED